MPIDPATLLAPILAPLTSLKGIGPERAALLARACGGARLIDLLFHLPDSYIDRRGRPSIKDAIPGRIATFLVEVVRQEAPATPRQPWRVTITDGTGFAELVFFRPAFLDRMAKGARILVSGRLESFNGRLTLTHPEHVLPEAQADKLPPIEPVWPLTAGLSPRQLGNAMAQVLARLPPLPEWIDQALLAREAWPDAEAALTALQAPAEPGQDGKARLRLAYDELLASQIALALARGHSRRQPGRAHRGNGSARATALERFGHRLTPGQTMALAEIEGDLAAPSRMLRLLQGDVGSGKTIVALLAMLLVAESGAQAALMAPTEILAKQHHATLSRLSPVPIALLTGSVTGASRAKTLRGIASGDIKLVIGTHALFQEAVTYHDLGLAVIDEQHRFGVDQRLLLGDKGSMTDVLVMTATPIPRTLLLTQWGEMAVSRLEGKPAGRQPVRTTMHSLSALAEVMDAAGRKIAEGGRVYWVCPLVAESMALDLAAAEQRFAALRERFGDTVAIAHGQQDAATRDAALAAFAAGRAKLLVATTVVEVGVDVPQASVMVIEHAERFGLAQLHQLRGRVGRGAETSFCLLLHDDILSETARKRLSLLRESQDGFFLAEEDFRLRGGGDMLGTRQSGLPGFRIANVFEHQRLLRIANRDAAALLARDPALTSARGEAARVLLTLFDREGAVRTLLAG
jgi:ATP-dependent DNA helicase RecG